MEPYGNPTPIREVLGSIGKYWEVLGSIVGSIVGSIGNVAAFGIASSIKTGFNPNLSAMARSAASKTGNAFTRLKSSIQNIRYRRNSESNWVTITHRGTPEGIAAKLASGKLPANYPIPNNAIIRAIDHPNPAVWVSERPPTLWNKVMSGIVGKKGLASITLALRYFWDRGSDINNAQS